MTSVNVNPTILEECQLRMHVDHVENMLCDKFFFNFLMILHVIIMREENMVTKLPLVMLRLLLFLSASLHMLAFACYDILFSYIMPMHRKYVRLRCDFHMLHDSPFVFQLLSFM